MACVASASAQVTLEIKHQEKTTHTTQTDIKIAQTLQLAGQEIVTKNSQILITAHATGARAGDGTLRIKMTIKKRTGKWEFPGGIAMEFDSAVPDRKAPIAELEPILTILHLLGIDHERLTYRHAGRNFRLTDVHGNVVKQILA